MVAKWKRTLLLSIIFTAVIGTAVVYADDIYETIKAKQVSVSVNDDKLNSKSYEVNGRTLVPLDEVKDELQAIVLKDGDQVNIYKPNVHMVVFKKINGNISLFGSLQKGSKLGFEILTQVDNLEKEAHALKIVIVDPEGNHVHEEVHPLNLRDHFWYNSHVSLTFDKAGAYKVQAFLQVEKNGRYHLVSEKTIQSLS